MPCLNLAHVQPRMMALLCQVMRSLGQKQGLVGLKMVIFAGVSNKMFCQESVLKDNLAS